MVAEHIQIESDLETRYTARAHRQLNGQAVTNDQVLRKASQTDYEMILEVQLDENAIVQDILIKHSLAPAHIVEPGQ